MTVQFQLDCKLGTYICCVHQWRLGSRLDRLSLEQDLAQVNFCTSRGASSSLPLLLTLKLKCRGCHQHVGKFSGFE